MTFETWAARHTPEMQTRLRVLLLRAPAVAAEFLDVRTDTGLTTFRLRGRGVPGGSSKPGFPPVYQNCS